MKKTQIFYIHGGQTLKNHKDYISFLRKRKVSVEKNKGGWDGGYLDKELGKKFDIIRPRMPLRENAKYKEWKIHFERFFRYLKDDIILIGQSLGGVFLAKYLSENKFPKRILSVYMVCPPFDDTIHGENLTGGFKLKKDLSLIERSSKRVYLLFSKKDKIVSVSHAKKYRKKLRSSKVIIYNHIKGHFFVSEFPEIVRMIKGDLRNKEKVTSASN